MLKLFGEVMRLTYGKICEILMDSGIENAALEAKILIEYFCGVSPSRIHSQPDAEYESPELFEAVDRRCEKYPLQYIIGEWYFYGERYKINENCLIPRSDTEMLVEYAIKNLPKNSHFADLCTGSGCIAISTLVHRPDSTCTAVDLFEATIDVARENAKLNGISEIGRRINFRICDLLLPNQLGDETFDAIISNPPYIRTAVVDTLDKELFSEPRAALDGGSDGLDFYRSIISNFKERISPGGFFLFEIGYDQRDDIISIAASHGLDCEVKNDLSGNPRMAIIKI